MPEKSFDIWAVIWAWLVMFCTRNGYQISGVIAAFIVTFFRSLLYGNRNAFSSRFAEAVVCGVLVATCQPLLKKIGLSEDFLPFMGVLLGLLGLDFVLTKVRQFLNKFISHKAGDGQNE